MDCKFCGQEMDLDEAGLDYIYYTCECGATVMCFNDGREDKWELNN